MIKKLAVIRNDGHRQCPFGLPIALSCKNAGDSVERMAPLDTVETEAREKFADANKKVYLHHATGERCIYADKIMDSTSMVHCDWGEGGQGLHDSPMRPSPYYTRVFNGLANNLGMGIPGMAAYPLHAYWENMEAQQLFSSMLTMYADADFDIKKDGGD